jgi:hypothetical protein
MRTIIVGVILGIICAAHAAHADTNAGPFGIGIMIGEPTGISAKYYLKSGDKAIDGGIGGNFAGTKGIAVHADFLWHPKILTSEPAFDMPFYVGGGVRVIQHDLGGGSTDFHWGVRIPAGILFDFNNVPIDVFLELALILEFRDGSQATKESSFGPDLSASVGVRYYF